MANLITSAQGIDHVTSKQDAHWHRKILGTDEWHNLTSENFSVKSTDSGLLTIKEMVGCLQGRFFEILDNEQIRLPNAGQYEAIRVDILCIAITITENQSIELTVIKGNGDDYPNPPIIPEGDLDSGDTTAYLPILQYQVTLGYHSDFKIINPYYGLINANLNT